MVEIIKSYVHGLDDALGGGLPRPGVTLIVGHPGTGKTTLSAQILSNRALRDNERGVYFSIVEPARLLVSQLSLFDFGFKDAIDKKLIDIKESIAMSGKEIVEIIIEQIGDLASQNYRNVVVDSISALLTLASPEHARTLLSLFSKYTSEHDVMLIIIGEMPLFSHSKSTLGFEEFIADVVVKLDFVEKGHRLVSRMSVIKNRFAEHSKAMYEVAITKRGFEVIGLMR
ncbi:MAG: hypothetical protein DRJ26_05185 [Candidatus Methanomethylicota archaeon]|uniref:KaiC domain-containing protein n=1 Tax=Thermoproteota archaeon TaxID=2056631 RepID=A0A497EX83_9CREN|nr:MAG: hypothetical protein DRJ26_05185 [Candidatus Verstraetearchaeota archaeon]